MDSAREAVDTLIDKTVNGFDIGTQTINITNLTKLTGQGTINGSGNGSANGSGNGNINGTIELVPTPEPTEEPEETPEPTETPAVTQAPAVTEAPTAALTRIRLRRLPQSRTSLTTSPQSRARTTARAKHMAAPAAMNPLLMWISILAGKAAVTLAAMRPSTMAAKARSTATLT